MSGAEEQRFADSHPLRLLPTFVWRIELTDKARARVNASVLKAIEELRGPLPPLSHRASSPPCGVSLSATTARLPPRAAALRRQWR